MVALAVERGYATHAALEFLGIHFDLVSPVKLDLSKLRWRLRYIKRLGAPLGTLQLSVSSLVAAALFWVVLRHLARRTSGPSRTTLPGERLERDASTPSSRTSWLARRAPLCL